MLACPPSAAEARAKLLVQLSGRRIAVGVWAEEPDRKLEAGHGEVLPVNLHAPAGHGEHCGEQRTERRAKAGLQARGGEAEARARVRRRRRALQALLNGAR